jgi:hypothetical protein
MAPEIALDRQRPAQYVFSGHVERAMAKLTANNPAKNPVHGNAD